MDYEMFLEVVKEKFMDYMPQRYQSGKLEIHAVNKVNVVWDALRISMPDNDRILPDIFVNEMYEKYKETGDLERVFRYTAAEYTNILEKNMKERLELDVNDMKDNVIFVLINTEQNKELIANVPNKPFQDLSVIFRWVISQDAQGMASIIVTKDMMEHAGLTLESLMEHAVENTKRICPPKIVSMREAMMEAVKDYAEPNLLDTLMETEQNPQKTMWIISNQYGVNGASAMLYEENLHKLAEKTGTDMYLLPSSIHEWIAVSTDMGEPSQLAEMIMEINAGAVKLEERLSNNVYFYDKDLRCVTMATDVPDKRLDTMSPKQQMVYDAYERR